MYKFNLKSRFSMKGGETMKIIGLVLVMLFAMGGACMAAEATLDVYDGWNLIGVPLVPFNPDPYEVFSGRTVDYSLYRTDAEGNSFTLGIDDFGSILLGDGYYYYNSDGAGSINYQGVEDAVPGIDGPTDMWISLPGVKEDPNVNAGGWHMISCPFQHDVSVDQIYFTDGTELKSWNDASGAGWVEFIMWYYNDGLAPFNNEGWGDDDMMRAGRGYFFRTGKDDLAMILKN